jgi:flagellar biosynthesis/type III secretory pathway M-ring protein FliF/YscJ
MDDFLNAIWSLAPTVLVGLLFWFVMWVVIRSDRHERTAQSRIEAEELARIEARGPAAS